jgi:hypothetical protein
MLHASSTGEGVQSGAAGGRARVGGRELARGAGDPALPMPGLAWHASSCALRSPAFLAPRMPTHHLVALADGCEGARLAWWCGGAGCARYHRGGRVTAQSPSARSFQVSEGKITTTSASCCVASHGARQGFLTCELRGTEILPGVSVLRGAQRSVGTALRRCSTVVTARVLTPVGRDLLQAPHEVGQFSTCNSIEMKFVASDVGCPTPELGLSGFLH